MLGPILFTIYTIPLGEVCRRHGSDGVQYQLYADDTQLYVSYKVGDAVDLLEGQRRIETCIAEISWMVMFMLKLNDDKTELVIIAPPYFL